VTDQITLLRDATSCSVKLTMQQLDDLTFFKAHLDKLSRFFYDSSRRALSKRGTGDPRLLAGSEVYASDLLNRSAGANQAQSLGWLHLPGSQVYTNDLLNSPVGANQAQPPGGFIIPKGNQSQ
jgi:hypothetical protein